MNKERKRGEKDEDNEPKRGGVTGGGGGEEVGGWVVGGGLDSEQSLGQGLLRGVKGLERWG